MVDLTTRVKHLVGLIAARKELVVVFAVGLICFSLLNGCSAGGTRGTGGSQIFEGSLLSLKGAPVAGVTITLADTGSSGVTDAQGKFSFETDAVSGSATLICERSDFTSRVTIPNITPQAVKITIDLEYDDHLKHVSTKDVRETEDHSGSGGSGGSGSGGHGSDDGSGHSGSGSGSDNSDNSSSGGSHGGSDNSSDNSDNSHSSDNGASDNTSSDNSANDSGSHHGSGTDLVNDHGAGTDL